MSSIKRCRSGLMDLSDIAKAPVSHGVEEPHDLEKGPSLRFRPYPLTPAALAASTARVLSCSGGFSPSQEVQGNGRTRTLSGHWGSRENRQARICSGAGSLSA